MKTLYLLLIWLVALSFSSSSCKKDSKVPEDEDWPSDSVRTVVEGLTHPWEILWGPDDHIWLTERGGRVSRLDPRSGALTPLLTITEVRSNGEGGLLGMALHPSFSEQPFVYLVYNYNRDGQYLEKVVRYTYHNNTLTEPHTLLDNIDASNIHNGSRLLIGPDNLLWITTGDAASPQTAQQTSAPNGKILRIHLDGRIPGDNPFPNNPVWSYGHRNPQGLVLVNGLLYASEHGPNIEDEVNIIEKEGNYGWPNVNGPCDEPGEASFCALHNVHTPIWSSGGSTVATAGLDYYNHERIAGWARSLLLVTLKGQRLYRLQLSADGRSVASQHTYFSGAFGRLRDVCVSPAGRVYLCTSNGNNDRIIEIGGLNED